MKYLLSLPLYASGLLCGWLFYSQYWQWRACFNEEGRCFDAETGVVYLQQSGMVWAGFTLLAFIAGTGILYRFKSLKKKALSDDI